MATPDPNVRVSPSGPLLDGTGDGTGSGPLAPPLDAIAGFSYLAPGGCKIGPEGNAFHPTYAWLYRSGTAGLTPQQQGVQGAELVSLSPEGDDYLMGVGVWLVTAQLCASYNTAAPLSAGEGGALALEVSLIDDAGAAVYTDGSNTILPTALAPRELSTNDSLVKKLNNTRALAMIEITPAMVAANGSQGFSGLLLQLERYTIADPNTLGIYASDSGWLEIQGPETIVNVRRYR